MNGPHKYGSGLKYDNTGHTYDEVAESFTESSPLAATVFTGETASTPTYTPESPFTPTYTPE